MYVYWNLLTYINPYTSTATSTQYIKTVTDSEDLQNIINFITNFTSN